MKKNPYITEDLELLAETAENLPRNMWLRFSGA